MQRHDDGAGRPGGSRRADVAKGLWGITLLSTVASVLVTATVVPVVGVASVAAEGAVSIFDGLPSHLAIGEPMLPTTLLTRDGDGGWQELARFYDQNRQPVSFDQVAPVLYDAVLSSEDPRYYQHGGVDLIGTTRALLSNARGNATQGGSSISQQYVKNVLIQQCEKSARDEIGADGTVVRTRSEVLQSCWSEATAAEGMDGYKRKLQEMRYAVALEKRYTKPEILLGYLNIANFGGMTYGIEAAARYYFGVPASELGLGQAATLAGMVQNPNAYRLDLPDSATNGRPDGAVDIDPAELPGLQQMREAGRITDAQYLSAADGYTATKGRQLYVLGRMFHDGKITREQYESAALEPIRPSITPARTGCEAAGATAYFCQYVVSVILNDEAFGTTAEERGRVLRQGGLRVYTTLDWRVQRAAEDAMARYAPRSVEGAHYGATAVSVDPRDGHVLAIAQNTAYAQDPTLAADEPGSTSIVYAGTSKFGSSAGFSAGSTFKIFTLVDWLKQGHSLNERVDGTDVPIRRFANSCTGDIVGNTWRPGNWGRVPGSIGTPLTFTAASLNSGYMAMASKLDLCDIGKTAAALGVFGSDGEPLQIRWPTQVIGPDAVSPIEMAGAYGTVANDGILCRPRAIERVEGPRGQELPTPERTCTRVLDSDVASAAAYALAGVMKPGGTGAIADPGGAPVLGKTGTHERTQTWMIESSSRVATAVWSGNADGSLNLFANSYRGRALGDIRYPIAKKVQGAANAAFGGDEFPTPRGRLIERGGEAQRPPSEKDGVAADTSGDPRADRRASGDG